MVVIHLIGSTQMGKKLHKLICTVQFAQVTVVCKGWGYALVGMKVCADLNMFSLFKIQ